jgi:hypothetical protein
MTDHELDRRRLLRATTAAFGGFCFGLAQARAAAALSLQRAAPDLAAALALSNRCSTASASGDPTHDAITRQLAAALDEQTAAPGTTLTRTAACPFCGCPVTVSRVVP